MVVVETHSMKVRNWLANSICLGMSWYIELQANPVMGCMHVCYPNPDFKFYHVAILDSISKVSFRIFAWKAFSSFWIPPSHHHKIFCTFCTFLSHFHSNPSRFFYVTISKSFVHKMYALALTGPLWGHMVIFHATEWLIFLTLNLHNRMKSTCIWNSSLWG